MWSIFLAHCPFNACIWELASGPSKTGVFWLQHGVPYIYTYMGRERERTNKRERERETPDGYPQESSLLMWLRNIPDQYVGDVCFVFLTALLYKMM